MKWYVIHYSAASSKAGNVEAPTAQLAAEEVASRPSTGESGYITVHAAPGSSIIYRLDLDKPLASRPDFRQIGRDGGRGGRSNPTRPPRPPRPQRTPRKSLLYVTRSNPDLLNLYRSADPNWYTRPDWVDAFKRGEPPPGSAGQTRTAPPAGTVKSDLSAGQKKPVEVAQSRSEPPAGPLPFAEPEEHNRDCVPADTWEPMPSYSSYVHFYAARGTPFVVALTYNAERLAQAVLYERGLWLPDVFSKYSTVPLRPLAAFNCQYYKAARNAFLPKYATSRDFDLAIPFYAYAEETKRYTGHHFLQIDPGYLRNQKGRNAGTDCYEPDNYNLPIIGSDELFRLLPTGHFALWNAALVFLPAMARDCGQLIAGVLRVLKERPGELQYVLQESQKVLMSDPVPMWLKCAAGPGPFKRLEGRYPYGIPNFDRFELRGGEKFTDKHVQKVRAEAAAYFSRLRPDVVRKEWQEVQEELRKEAAERQEQKRREAIAAKEDLARLARWEAQEREAKARREAQEAERIAGRNGFLRHEYVTARSDGRRDDADDLIEGTAYIYRLFRNESGPWTLILLEERMHGGGGDGTELTGVLLDPEGEIVGTGRRGWQDSMYSYASGMPELPQPYAGSFVKGRWQSDEDKAETILQLAGFLKKTGKVVMRGGVDNALQFLRGRTVYGYDD